MSDLPDDTSVGNRPASVEPRLLSPFVTDLTRRVCLVAGASAGAGAVLGLATKSVQASRAWRPLRSGEYITINGLRYEAECGDDPRAIQVSKAGVVRFEMIPRNFWKKDSRGDSERTELDGWPRQLESHKQIWSSWSMYYEPGPPSTSDWCILHQILHVGGWPMPHLLKPNGDLLWVGAAATDGPGSDRVRHRQKIEQGMWLNFVETYKFDPDGGNGFWKSWLNGRQVLDYKGALGNKGSKHCYAKFGIYRSINKTWDGITDFRIEPERWKVPETLVVRFANMRFDHADLSHLIANPEPVPAFEPWPQT